MAAAASVAPPMSMGPPYMVAFGCVLNLLPFTLSEGPGATRVAMRTDGGIILDLLRLIASLRTDSGT